MALKTCGRKRGKHLPPPPPPALSPMLSVTQEAGSNVLSLQVSPSGSPQALPKSKHLKIGLKQKHTG